MGVQALRTNQSSLCFSLLVPPGRAWLHATTSSEDNMTFSPCETPVRAAGNECATLSADEWEVVADQLLCEDGGRTWCGILRGVCHAARDGVERTAAALKPDGSGWLANRPPSAHTAARG